jgi:hypothetical protein
VARDLRQFGHEGNEPFVRIVQAFALRIDRTPVTAKMDLIDNKSLCPNTVTGLRPLVRVSGFSMTYQAHPGPFLHREKQQSAHLHSCGSRQLRTDCGRVARRDRSSHWYSR